MLGLCANAFTTRNRGTYPSGLCVSALALQKSSIARFLGWAALWDLAFFRLEQCNHRGSRSESGDQLAHMGKNGDCDTNELNPE